jgi:hypothetical protein
VSRSSGKGVGGRIGPERTFAVGLLDEGAGVVHRPNGMADYIFVYFKEGSHVGSSPWSGELELAKNVARGGLLRRGADEFQIRSSTLNGPLVWEESRSA